MNSGRYTIKDFLTHNNMEQLIIPEIQRDYVWGPDNVKSLLESINEEANSEENDHNLDELANLPSKYREIIERERKRNKKFTNIGFIYAYYDLNYSNKYFLIDGQQRMTTLFLLLLALSVENEEDKENFKLSYFDDNKPKVDYKVREASQDFLQNFVEYILNNNIHENVEENVKNAYWYFDEYESDLTIQSILKNYVEIQNFINSEKCKINFEYVENQVEFWYFDTDKSKQGEELYIYMNSRGESVQPNEKIKALLLNGLSEKDKIYWGKEWEEWQDFFWKNRDINENADKGFNEFLKWIKIINYICKNPNKLIGEQEDFIRDLDPDNLSPEFLSLEDIQSYMASFKKLCYSLPEYVDYKWKYGKMDFADYIRLLPVLMYLKSNPEAIDKSVKSFTRFFYNLPRLYHIGRNPVIYIVIAVKLINEFINDNKSDITDLINYSDREEFKGILTDEEKFKLNLYKNPPDNLQREDLENIFWEAEDYTLNYGRITFIFECMEIDISVDSYSSFSFNSFCEIFEVMKELFGYEDDLLRRALLTKGDYSLKDGKNPTLGGIRYTFISTKEKWRELIHYSRKKIFVKKLLLEYNNQKQSTEGRNEILKKVIDNYLKISTNDSWINKFIENPEILDYCRSKNISRVGDSLEDIYLLKGSAAFEGTYEKLSDFIENINEENNQK